MASHQQAVRDPKSRAIRLQEKLSQASELFQIMQPEELHSNPMLYGILRDTFSELGKLLSRVEVVQQEEPMKQIEAKPTAKPGSVEEERLRAFDRIFDDGDLVTLTDNGQHSDLLRSINVGNFILYAREYLMPAILWNRDTNPYNRFRKTKEEPHKSNRGITFLVNETERLRDGEAPQYNDNQASVIIAILKALSMLQGNAIVDNYHDFDDRIGLMSEEWVQSEVEKAVKSSHRLVRG